MKNQQIIHSACVAALALGATSLQAADSWNGNGNDHDWSNASNWSTGAPVAGTGSTGDILYIDAAAANNYAVYAAAQGQTYYNKVHVGYNSDGRLDVTGGTLIGDNTGNAYIGRGGHSGTLNVAGGTFRTGGPTIIGIDNNSVGVANVSGGTLENNRDGTIDSIAHISLGIGAGGTAQGALNLTGGSLYTRFGMSVGNSSGNGSGLFHVTGSSFTAKIGTDNGANLSNAGFWYQRANGTLQGTVDSSDFSLGSIDIVNGSGGGAYVTFAAGSTLSLGFSGAAPTAAMSWDLMTWDDNTTLTDNGLTLDSADAADGWSLSFADTGGTSAPNTLRVTFTPVPEPGTLAMAALGLATLFVFHRRK